MITLPSHTFHALQPLDVVCFKPFKTTFRKERDISMVRRNYTELDTITLAGWVDKTLNLTFTRESIMSRFKGYGFGHLTLWPWIQKLALVLYTHCKI